MNNEELILQTLCEETDDYIERCLNALANHQEKISHTITYMAQIQLTCLQFINANLSEKATQIELLNEISNFMSKKHL